jgi:hypothetical protein
VSCIDLWILRRPSQSFTRETNSCSRTEVSVLGIDVKTVSAYSFRVATIVLLILLGLGNQILAFVVSIPAEPMQERKSIAHRNTDFGSEFDSSPCLSANNGSYLPLNQIDKAIRDAPGLTVEQNGLLPVELTAGEELMPPMPLEG